MPDRMMAVLDREFPAPKVELHFSNPLELLMATILSAQCTDDRVNRVTPGLFRKYRSAQDYAAALPAVLEGEIRSTGFYKNKARNIIACGRILVEKHGGGIPRTMEDLLELPGVGRKTANVVLGTGFGQPAIVVDTHVRRVSGRLGLTRSDDPGRIEEDLSRFFPRSAWTRVSLQLLLLGRRVCRARAPRCPDCGFRRVCPFGVSRLSKTQGKV